MTARRCLGAALSAALALVGACGSDRPPVTDLGSGGSTSGETGLGPIGGVTAPAGCGSSSSACTCLDLPLFGEPPTLYFVLDRSGSMAADDKWNHVRRTVATILRRLGPRARFGATMFPDPRSSEACAPGLEAMAIQPGDPPSSGADGPTTSMLVAVTRVVPAGGTPTGPTLASVRARLQALKGRAYVILATDGAPNCSATARCGVEGCLPNLEDFPGCPRQGPRNCCEPPLGLPEDCLDAAGALTETAALRAAGVPVYVVGLPGASPYASLLDELALAGGTAQPKSPRYFAVDAASEERILETLKKVAATITATCNFELQERPETPSLVNVYLDDEILPYEPVNGWTLSEKTVTLVGAACARVQQGDVLSVRIVAGCPRVEPR